MGRLLGRDLVSCGRFKTVDCIVPVPLHPRKLKQRGFNQSALIAKGVSEMMPAMKETQFLQRVVHSKSQTKKSRWERWKNTHEVFSFEPPKDVDFAHVLLLDDVITTGATIESCLNAIQKNYSGVVSIATLACPMN